VEGKEERSGEGVERERKVMKVVMMEEVANQLRLRDSRSFQISRNTEG
jgi:hypothetical protein